MRTVVYTGTRNVYGDMSAACKSLLKHNGADRVFFLIEDDSFPEQLPEMVRCLNVSGQAFFRHDGPNYSCRWTYMTMMKIAVPLISEIAETTDRVLVMDVDTIVTGDLDGLWELPPATVYMTREVGRPYAYYNAGVMLMDVDAMAGEAPKVIRAINVRKMDFPDQDAMNNVMRGKISELPPEFNTSNWTVKPTGEPRIVHYAAVRNWHDRPEWKRYAGMSWADAIAPL